MENPLQLPRNGEWAWLRANGRIEADITQWQDIPADTLPVFFIDRRTRGLGVSHSVATVDNEQDFKACKEVFDRVPNTLDRVLFSVPVEKLRPVVSNPLK